MLVFYHLILKKKQINLYLGLFSPPNIAVGVPAALDNAFNCLINNGLILPTVSLHCFLVADAFIDVPFVLYFNKREDEEREIKKIKVVSIFCAIKKKQSKKIYCKIFTF